MTFLCVVLDHANRKLYCANAGHCAGYLISPPVPGQGHKVSPIGRAGIPLGSQADLAYDEVDTHDWAPGAKAGHLHRRTDRRDGR